MAPRESLRLGGFQRLVAVAIRAADQECRRLDAAVAVLGEELGEGLAR